MSNVNESFLKTHVNGETLTYAHLNRFMSLLEFFFFFVG